jgi:hydrogenase expression/formation protein HypE
VKDLAVGGAQPLWLSAAFIIEEGCEVTLLRRIVSSMAAEAAKAAKAAKAGVRLVTGDTKVVERGKGDGVFVTTSGIGVIPPGRDIGAVRIRPGDVAIVNGVLGDHGATILAARGDLALSVDLDSDCAGLGHLMQAAFSAAPGITAARDCTRGGLASALNEMAGEAGLAVEIDEALLPLRPEVAGVCEILGLDPLYLVNEGRLVLFCPADQVEAALAAMRALPEGAGAVAIGRTGAGTAGRVTMRTRFGGARIVDMLVGEQLPRIC